MTTSPQHTRWIRSGLQWQLARPLMALRDRMRGYGYTVYDIGDTSHLDHVPPEDHTPYSETGWPGTTPYGWVTAIDIMPPDRPGLPSLQALGAQIFNDRQAGFPGVAWLKYMNWGPTNNNSAVHDKWTPGHVRTSSDDTGHLHASGRSDHVISATVAELSYDPVARLRGQNGDEVDNHDLGRIWSTLLTGRTPDGYVVGTVNDANLTALINEFGAVTLSSLAEDLKEIKAALAKPTAVLDAAAVAHEIAAELAADPANPLTRDDIPALADVLAEKLTARLGAKLSA